MKTFYSIIVAAIVIGFAETSRGDIEDFKQITIDFTDAAATNAATWSTPDKLTVSTNGLGWDGVAASSRDGWIQTKPLALGLSWRTPGAVSVRVAIQPPTGEISLNSGQKTTPYGGDVYVRYSPDRKHWSSWQVLEQTRTRTPPEEKKNPGRHFNATVQVPYRERERYGELLSEYSRLDVAWQSDEEAAVRWIVGREPDFFAKQIPFIGYVEFLFEGQFYGSQRVRSFHAEISYGMTGIHSVPKDKSVYQERSSIPWRFEAGDNSNGKP